MENLYLKHKNMDVCEELGKFIVLLALLFHFSLSSLYLLLGGHDIFLKHFIILFNNSNKNNKNSSNACVRVHT